MLLEREVCCSCEACVSACPCSAIEMQEDTEGFKYPEIDINKCVNCGLCEKVCPIKQRDSIKLERHNIEIYAGYEKNEKELLRSASGGVASALAKYVISLGGVVVGVTFSDDFCKAEYVLVNNEKELCKLRGSKYIQSEKNKIHKKVKEYLETGKTVLFIGLPCDVAGMKSFLRKDYENLLTCELICMGPTSPKVQSDYIRFVEKKYRSKVKEFSVRYKMGKWTPYFVRAVFENGKKNIEPYGSSPYSIAFRTLNKHSCAQCHFRGDNRVGDITVGDFWGASKEDAFWNEKGMSVIFANTIKGVNLLHSVPNFELQNIPIEKATLRNGNINNVRKISPSRARFSRVFIKSGLFIAALGEVKLRTRIKRIVTYMLPSRLYEFTSMRLNKKDRQ